MNTVRVDISYRPLRIGWLIHSEDKAAFRMAARWSFVLWGGCFNPIIAVDQDEAASLVERFRVDVLWPVKETEATTHFAERFPHLISPFMPDEIFFPNEERSFVQVLDLQNMLAHELDLDKDAEFDNVTLHVWQPDDPLADAFLAQFGEVPPSRETGIDYKRLLEQHGAKGLAMGRDQQVPDGPLEKSVTLRDLCAHRTERHWSSTGGQHTPAIFLGDASSTSDLICYWNLRAADIRLWFVDLAHEQRFEALLRSCEIARRKRDMKRSPPALDSFLWSRREDAPTIRPAWARERFCHVTPLTWNGLNLRVPTMHLGDASSLGVLGTADEGRPVVSFAFGEKPFAEDVAFHNQRLVASVRLITGTGAASEHTFSPPYVPELNEFVARQMIWHPDELRVEPERLGVVVDVTERDCRIASLPVQALIERIFALAGYRAKLSAAGLLTRQLIRQLGGLQAARVFKFPGVRRLLHGHGARATFDRSAAEQQLRSHDLPAEARFPDNPGFGIDGEKPSARRVFEYLVEKGLLRIGVELNCPICRIPDWVGVDSMRETIQCQLCGTEFDARRQLSATEWSYRRSGVFGAEKNAMGAIPVALTLQQLDASFHTIGQDHLFSPSLDLESVGGAACPTCEVDFVWLLPRLEDGRVAVILGECKDRGRLRPDKFSAAIDNLRHVADRFPLHRFKVFVLIAKLAAFTPDEIETAQRINEGGRQRLILLTHQELEPYSILDRWDKNGLPMAATASTPEGLALATWHRYFRSTATPPSPPATGETAEASGTESGSGALPATRPDG